MFERDENKDINTLTVNITPYTFFAFGITIASEI